MNKLLKELHDWLDEPKQMTRQLIKDKIIEIDAREKAKTKKVSNCFKPPSVEEIRAYCLIRNNNVDPEMFFDFYQSKGWLVGKVKMKDWQAAVRTWERNNKEQQATSTQKYGRMNEEQALGTFSAANNVKIPGT